MIINFTAEDPSLTPSSGSRGAAGYDLKIHKFLDDYGYSPRNWVLSPGQAVKYTTGVSLSIPNGYYGLVVPRSSMGRKGLILTNTVGIIDSDYRGEIFVCVMNISNEVVDLEKGERLVQLIIQKYENVDFKLVYKLDDTDRGANGFGSTGKF